MQESLTYEEKKDIYLKEFSLGNFHSKNVNEKLILVSLLSVVYIKMKEKNQNITPLEILISITKQKSDNSSFYQMLESLSILVEDFCYDCDKSESFGLKTSQEIINKIKEILNTWMPF
jgi:hypothetical protein